MLNCGAYLFSTRMMNRAPRDLALSSAPLGYPPAAVGVDIRTPSPEPTTRSRSKTPTTLNFGSRSSFSTTGLTTSAISFCWLFFKVINLLGGQMNLKQQAKAWIVCL